MNSEINLDEPFGRAIFDHVLRFECRINLEIGSWDGEGSTKCFVEAMKLIEGEKRLDCIELIHEKIDLLRARYKALPFVNPIQGSSISYDELILKDFERIWSSVFNKLAYPKSQVAAWFRATIEALHLGTGILSSNSENVYDSVLIDGSEFTGYSEYSILCRTGRNRVSKLIFLDDVHNAYKCNQVYHELLATSDWHLIDENPHVRNGYAIFAHADIMKPA